MLIISVNNSSYQCNCSYILSTVLSKVSYGILESPWGQDCGSVCLVQGKNPRHREVSHPMSHTAREAKSGFELTWESGSMDHIWLHLCPIMGSPIGQMASIDWGGKGNQGRRYLGSWAGQLAFVKWSRTEALFSPRHSKDKASGRSWALLKQRDKAVTPEVEEDFPVCTRTGNACFLGVEKEGGPSNSKCGQAPIGLCDGIHLSKKLGMHLGEDPRTSQVWKEEIIGPM